MFSLLTKIIQSYAETVVQRTMTSAEEAFNEYLNQFVLILRFSSAVLWLDFVKNTRMVLETQGHA